MSELKPCPFCGGSPKRMATKRADGSEFNIHYYCNHEDISSMRTVETGHFGKEEYAKDCWNRRAPIVKEGVE